MNLEKDIMMKNQQLKHWDKKQEQWNIKVMDGWMGGWIDRWMDGWMDGRTDGRTDGQTD